MKQRIISAIVIVLVMVPLIILGGYPYTIAFTIIGLFALKELLDLEKNIPLVLKISAFIFTLFLICYNYNTMKINFLFDAKLMIILGLFYFISIVIFNDLKKYNYKDAIHLIVSILFISILFNGLIIVRKIGVNEIAYLFLISSLTDTFALFTGKYLGKHKLSSISPNKTVEGSIGGSIIGSILTTIIYLALTGVWTKYLWVFGITLFLSVLGQIGDLLFSSIKRVYGIKDFSNLIPGHGGILDRLDSVFFILLGYIIIMM